MSSESQVDDMLALVADKKVTLGVLGMGYVGLPFATHFAEAGFQTIGFDVFQARVDQRASGSGAGSDVKDDVLKRVIDTGRLTFTTDFSQLAKCQCIVICVPTPLSKYRTPDLSFIVNAMDLVVQHRDKSQPLMVVLESTTYPGCTEELIVKRLNDEEGTDVGRNAWVAFSPERVDPGNKDFDLRITPKVMGGHTPDCFRVCAAMYGTVIQNLVSVDSTKEAELVKLLENTFRAVNIGLVNELAHMADRMGINIWNVINAAKSKPFGFMGFTPGPGIGGHCIPLDPQYLSYTAKTFNHYSRFIELASDINENMPEFCINKVMRLLNKRGKAMSQSRVLLMGVAYKKNVSDCRESPSKYLFNFLLDLDATVDYHDPYVGEYVSVKDGPTHKCVDLTPETVASYDLVLISTDHDSVDWPMVCEHAQSIFDARNAIGQRGLDSDAVKAKLTLL